MRRRPGSALRSPRRSAPRWSAIGCGGGLREIVRRNAALIPQDGHDYVLIGRRAALTMPFERINAEFLGAMTRLSRGRR